MSTELKYTLSVNVLYVWSKIYNIYKVIKRKPVLAGSLVAAIVLLMAILIYFREPAGLNFDFDPYDVMGVERNVTLREVKSKYRQLTKIWHPDVNNVDDPATAKAKWIRIQRSNDILTNEQQRQNFDKYGNPNGPPLNLFDVETYPDFIMNPGKKFLAFYGILTVFLMSLPLFVLLLIPGVKAPPQWIRDRIYRDLNEGTQLLAKEDAKSLEVFERAQTTWNSLVSTFPRYKKSLWGTIIPIQLTSRIILAKLILGKISTEDFEKATKEFENYKKDPHHRNNLKEHEVLDQIKDEVKDLRSALTETRKTGAAKLLSAVSAVKR
jgi:curved DNA-binding protein CbpA